MSKQTRQPQLLEPKLKLTIYVPYGIDDRYGKYPIGAYSHLHRAELKLKKHEEEEKEMGAESWYEGGIWYLAVDLD